MTILFDTSHLSISHECTSNLLLVEWRGVQSAADYVADCKLLLQYVVDTESHKMLCDSSEAFDGWDGIGDWVSMEYFPRLAKAGIRSVAWVNAEDWLTKATIMRIVHRTTRPRIGLFEDSVSAHTWLERVPVAKS